MKDTHFLAHGLRQLTRDTKSGVSCLQTLLMRRNEDLQMTFGNGCHTTLNVKLRFFREKVRKIINHRSPMQTEKSQPSGQRIMPETR